MKKRKNKLLFLFITLILIFSFSIASFATAFWNTVAVLRVYELTVLSSEGITIQNSGNGYTYLSGTTSQVGLSFVYDTYSAFNLIVGQSYKIDFTCENFGFNTSARSVGLLIYATNDLTNGSSETAITYGDFQNMQLSYSGNFECQFTYSGQQYIVLQFVVSKLNSFEISPLRVQRYNSNAELQSQLDEQNSLVNQQIEQQSEQFSEIYQQNEELQSKLFDEGETYTMPDVDLIEQYSVIEQNPFLDGASDFESNNHIVNGVKAFAFLFTLFWDGISSDDSLSWIRYLVYLSAVVSLFLLVVGSVSIISDTASPYDKDREASDKYDRSVRVRKEWNRRQK